MTETGDLLTLEVGPVAHGGHCVARHDGRVVFVRHSLPGERVQARVTGSGGGGHYLTADAEQIERAAPGRREPPCRFAGPGRCGGCDFQHADPATTRGLKAAVIVEQLQRLAGIDRDVTVEPVAGDEDGLRWRTRMRFAADAAGRLGLHRFHSDELELIDDCLIARPELAVPELAGRTFAAGGVVDVLTDTAGSRLVIGSGSGRGRGRAAGGPGTPWLVHSAAGRMWRVTGTGFWQVHPGAPDTLADAVLQALDPQAGESALDLYAGVGLFAGVLARRVGRGGRVTAIESDPTAAEDARMNLRDLPGTRVVTAPVDARLGALVPGQRTVGQRAAGQRGAGQRAAGSHVDLVVLDPPRTGARAPVVRAIAALGPRRIAYVACDPAALARDLATFAGLGYRLGRLRAFDLFPMTAHVEAVATLERTLETS